MTIPSLNEVAAYLTGVVKMVRGETEGLNYLDLSWRGFWRSFWAFAFSLPAYGVFWMSERNSLLASSPDIELGAGFFLRAAVSDVAGVIAAICAVAIAARPLGISDRFVQWVVAGNWLSLPLSYATAAVTLVSLGAVGSQGAAAPLLLIVVLVSLVITWRVYRVALDGDGLLALILLVISEFVFVLVSLVIS
ncbi:hypothetical protein [Hoeflea sp. TYP-13]|uniref:hypothetical protein n=1 Tax=Hoeflea sp. TYP-13 TaxID=3230023 RepID=UPI0034C6252C